MKVIANAEGNRLTPSVVAFNDKGEVIFNFGKHKGRTVKDVLLNEPGYYNWMMEGDFPQQTKRVLTRLRLEMLNH